MPLDPSRFDDVLHTLSAHRSRSLLLPRPDMRGGRCRQDQQPPCVLYGNTRAATIPCCDNVPCTGGRCRYD